MKRLLFVIALLIFALSLVVLPAAAQDAPTGTWLGTWPYVAPGTHHLNSFASGGLNDNLGTVYRSFVELPPAYYVWATNEYVPLLAESWGFVDDNAAYQYTIKEGALWSDGSPVTAQDVIDTFTLGRILNWSQWTFLTGVEAVDERTVRSSTASTLVSEFHCVQLRMWPSVKVSITSCDVTGLPSLHSAPSLIVYS